MTGVKERNSKGCVIEYKTPDGKTEEARFDDLILACGESYLSSHHSC